MTLLQIQNFDSLRKAIIDSVIAAQKQQFNSLDYINKVDSFYNNSWTKLAILFGLIGVFVPLVINYIQIKRNEKDHKNIKDGVKAELSQEIDKYLEEKITKIQHASEGVSYHILANIYYDKNNFKEAFGEIVNAMTCYFIGDDYTNFQNAIEDFYKYLPKVNRQIVEDFKDQDYYDINTLLQKISDSNDEKYCYHLSKIKTELFKLR